MGIIVGIIGGMGPLATIDLMKKIIEETPVTKDQDHIHMVIDNFPQIPDRTTAILANGEDPTPYLIESAQRLKRAGADVIAVACNTAHYFLPFVQDTVPVPILHMPRETAQFILESKIEKVGLLATDGTLKTRLYQDALEANRIVVIEPDENMQQKVMKGIYSIKQNDLKKGTKYLREAAESLTALGAEAIIAGCTEVPIVLHSTEKIRVIDPTKILAETVVKLALNGPLNRVKQNKLVTL